jgi:molecular chaperone Hsp33
MNTKDKIEQINLCDRAIRVLSADGLFRAVILKNTQSAKDAQTKHGYPQFVAESQSKILSTASLIAAFLKGEERVVVDIQSDGRISKLFAEAMQIGEVRGFANYEVTEAPNFANASLRISRILYNQSEPITGIVELKSDLIQDDVEEYLTMSEQIPSFTILDVSFDENGIVKQSGGIIVQAMPGAGAEAIKALGETLSKSERLCHLYDQGLRPDQVLKQILPFEFSVIKSSRVDFFCRCSKEQFTAKLLTLGADEIKAMKAEGHNELVCQYCNKHYTISDEDFDSMINEISIKMN